MSTYTLTIVFDKDVSKLLICLQEHQGKLNFVGGKKELNESLMDASYRELFEETGISKNDIDLKFVRHEVVTKSDSDWGMYVTAGILNKKVQIKQEKNRLFWLDTEYIDVLANKCTFGDGNCYTFYREACHVLGLTPLEISLGCNNVLIDAITGYRVEVF